jgi:protein disulfide-isomerase A1
MAPANLCLLFCLVCELVSGGEFYEDNDGVLLLDNTNFDLAVEAHELLLVKFYAPWCGHCKKFAPVFADIATKLRAVQSAALPQSQAQVRLGKLDGTESVSIAERFEVKGYPKLKLFRNGRPEPYNGKRTADDVLGYLQKFQRAAVKEMKSVEEAVEFAGHSDAALLGFFDKLEGLEWDNFQKAGKVHDEVRFAVTTSHKIISHFKVEETPTALLFKTFGEGEEKLEKLTGKAIGDPRRLNRFVVANSMPTVIDFSVKDMRKFLGPGRVRFFGVQLMMFLDPTSPDFEQQRHALQYVADKNKERMIHVLISPNHAKVHPSPPSPPALSPPPSLLLIHSRSANSSRSTQRTPRHSPQRRSCGLMNRIQRNQSVTTSRWGLPGASTLQACLVSPMTSSTACCARSSSPQNLRRSR